jgi:hypothetical protein
MNKTVASYGLVALALIASACGPQQQAQERQRTFPAEEAAKGTPILETESYDSVESFTLAQTTKAAKAPAANPQAAALADLYKRAYERIAVAYSTKQNVVVVSIAYSVTDMAGTTGCAYVQIQQSNFGEPVVLETLTPTGQSATCVPTAKKGLGLGTVGLLIKLAGNNYAGGIGVGAIYYDGTSLAGCAAGAVGYASQTYNAANGTYGAWCSEIVSVSR